MCEECTRIWPNHPRSEQDGGFGDDVKENIIYRVSFTSISRVAGSVSVLNLARVPNVSGADQ